MNLKIPFHPRLFDTLKGYTAKDFVPDLIAGVTVGIVALPLAMAFAIASGVKPEAGIFTAVIAGLLSRRWAAPRYRLGGRPGRSSSSSSGLGPNTGSITS